MNTESKIFGISLRGAICLIVVLTVCAMSGLGIKIEEPLYTMVGSMIGFYFGQKEKNPPKPTI